VSVYSHTKNTIPSTYDQPQQQQQQHITRLVKSIHVVERDAAYQRLDQACRHTTDRHRSAPPQPFLKNVNIECRYCWLFFSQAKQ
jgi:hypothetical protein